MNTEELLKPRFKQIADYPNNNSPIGRIHGHSISGTINKMPLDEWLEWHKKYPAIYRQLSWWEERSEFDMPEYVKHKESGRIYRVADADEKYPLGFMFDRPMTEHWVNYDECLPATQEEYQSYIKTKGLL